MRGSYSGNTLAFQAKARSSILLPRSTLRNEIMKIKLPSELLWLCPIEVDDLIRLGRNTDGGYVTPRSVVEHADGLLSLGLGNDWSFDESWHQLKPNDPIHMYDGVSWAFLDSSTHTLCEEFFTGNKVYYKEHVYPDELSHGTSFEIALERLGGKNIFLKMDIEGSEVPIMPNILAARDRIIGITLELHHINRQRDQFKKIVDDLKQYYKIVHIHGNNSTGLREQGLTNCFELTFVRNDLIPGNKLRYQIFLEDLDYSNLPDSDDYEYYFEDPGIL